MVVNGSNSIRSEIACCESTRSCSERPLNPKALTEIYRNLAQRAGLPDYLVRGLTSHSARVGAAQDLLKSGETLPQIMRRGGWKSPAIVMRYTEQTDLQPME